MEIISYPIESEVDSTRITALFEERGIPYTIKKNSDLFPYNGERRTFGEILVLREFESEAQAIFEEIKNSVNVEISLEESDAGNKNSNQGTKKQRSRWKAILIIYSLIVTVLLLKYWDMNRRYSNAKNFKYAWNLSNTELFVRYKQTQQLTQICSDDNFDLNFEKVENYSKNYVLTSLSRDINEDGFFDETIFYAKDGKITGKSNYDHDGWLEESVMILENGDTLKLTDRNQDGFLEQ